MKQRTLCLAAAAFFAVGALPGVGTAQDVGMFLGDQPDCRIIGPTVSRSCTKDAAVKAGDVIETKVKAAALPIQWLSPELVRLDPVQRGYRVAFSPPPGGSGVLAVLGDLVGFARHAGRQTHRAATRGPEVEPPRLPGAAATLLPGQRVSFRWCSKEAHKLVIRDAGGATVREIEVAPGTRAMSVTPEELGMVPGVPYRWELTGAGEEGSIRLLGGPAAKMVADALNAVDREEGSAAEKGLRKAAMVKFLSDNYGGEFAFGWLQYQLIQELPAGLAAGDRAAAQLMEAGILHCQ
ncbi:hypothetical protein M1B72_10965 [Geomonas paludis]|uniref:DUF4384 domain-containing protein n=1 Tax=Geomonas paludis TaxID=2740185 RepID=A0A6V8MSZ3_9BACT|nr:hypothetical protein [Geomonas paludis]UPU38203.1 hypothetical protein M1B72_10965 [Geomonas paludis]GFO63265.1 hypothetical protein GMPD_11840 [Geomonas paludis]